MIRLFLGFRNLANPSPKQNLLEDGGPCQNTTVLASMASSHSTTSSPSNNLTYGPPSRTPLPHPPPRLHPTHPHNHKTHTRPRPHAPRTLHPAHPALCTHHPDPARIPLIPSPTPSPASSARYRRLHPCSTENDLHTRPHVLATTTRMPQRDN